MVGGAAWAVMIVGAFMAFKWIQAGAYQPIATFYLPGVLLTIVTQVQWAAYRKQMSEEDASGGQSSVESSFPDKPPRPSARKRRKTPRAGRSKS